MITPRDLTAPIFVGGMLILYGFFPLPIGRIVDEMHRFRARLSLGFPTLSGAFARRLSRQDATRHNWVLVALGSALIAATVVTGLLAGI